MSIEEGQELGRVGGFLTDPDKRRIAGFVMSTQGARGGVRVVPIEAISSFGTFALTITKTTAVIDLTASPKFMQIFEKDIMLLGCEVRDGENRLVGFVKDVSVEISDGALLLIRITSEAGFMSPYEASVPIGAVRSIEKDRIVIDEEHRVTYTQEAGIPGGGRPAFVPLVAREEDLKRAMSGRIEVEIEKLRRELRDRLFDQHEEYFIARQKQLLEDTVTASVREWVEENVQAGVRDAIGDITARIGKALESAAPRDVAEGLARRLEQLADEQQAALAALRADLDARAGKVRDDFLEQLAQIEARASAADEKAANTHAELAQALENQRDEYEKAISQTAASIRGDADASHAETRALLDRINGLSQKLDAREQSAEQLTGEFHAFEESVRGTLDQIWTGSEKRLSALEESVKLIEDLFARVEKDIESGRDGIDALGQKLEQSTAALAASGEIQQGHETRISNIMNDFGFLSSALETIQEIHNLNQERMMSGESAVAALQSRLDEADARIASNQQRFADFELHLETLESAKKQFDGYVDRIDAAKNEVEEHIGRLSAARETSENRLAELDEAAQYTKQKTVELHDTLQSFETKIADLQQNIDAALSRLDSTAQESQALDATLRALMGNVKDTVEQLAAQGRDLESFKETLPFDIGNRMAAIEGRVAEFADANMGVLDEELNEIVEALKNEFQERIDMVLQAQEAAIEEVTAVAESEALRTEFNARMGEMESAVSEIATGNIADRLKTIEERMEALRRAAVQEDALGRIEQRLDNDIEQLQFHIGEIVADTDKKIENMAAALKDRAAESEDAVTRAGLEDLAEKFREQQQVKIANLQQLVFDTLDGRIDEVKSLIESRRIESMIDNTVDRGMAALQERFEAMQRQVADIRDTLVEQDDGAAERVQSDVSAIQDAQDALSGRMAAIEESVPVAAKLVEQIDGFHRDVGALDDLEARLTQKVDAAIARAEQVSAILPEIVRADDLESFKNDVLAAVREKTSGVENNIKQIIAETQKLMAIKDEIKQRTGPALQREFRNEVSRLQKSISELERNVSEQVERRMRQTLESMNSNWRQRAEEMQEHLKQETSDIVNMLNVFNARILQITSDIEQLEQEQPASVGPDRTEHIIKELESRLETSGRMQAPAAVDIEGILSRVEEAARQGMEKLARDFDALAMRMRQLEARAMAAPEQIGAAPAEIFDNLNEAVIELDDRMRDTESRLRADIDSVAGALRVMVREAVESIPAAAVKSDMPRDVIDNLRDSLAQTASALFEKSQAAINRVESLVNKHQNDIKEITDRFDAAEKISLRPKEKIISQKQLDAMVSRIENLQESVEKLKANFSSQAFDTLQNSEQFQSTVHRGILDTLRTRGLRELLFNTGEAFTDAEEESEELPPEISEQEAVEIFGERLTRRMIGRRVEKDIFTDDNRCIVRKGEVVDRSIIKLAKDHGKFLELSLNTATDKP